MGRLARRYLTEDLTVVIGDRQKPDWAVLARLGRVVQNWPDCQLGPTYNARMETVNGERFWDWVHRFLEDPGYETRLGTPDPPTRTATPEAVLPATATDAQEIMWNGNVVQAPSLPHPGNSRHESRNRQSRLDG